MDAHTQLQTAYRHARLFRRNILTGMHPDTAQFEFVCTMQAHSISPRVWKHALMALDLDALDAFLQAPKHNHVITWRDIKPGMEFCEYPAYRKAEVYTVLDAYCGWHTTCGWIPPTPSTFAERYELKPRIIQPSKYAKVRVINRDGKIYWTGIGGQRLIVHYPQRASASGWLGWIDPRYADELLEEGEYNPREMLRV